eukprot:9277179-Ditylum_brightwellii.AAC.1
MVINWNIHGLGTCNANHKGFDLEGLKLDNLERGHYSYLVDDCLGMVIKRCKGSNTLQTVKAIMKKGVTMVYH